MKKKLKVLEKEEYEMNMLVKWSKLAKEKASELDDDVMEVLTAHRDKLLKSRKADLGME